MHNVQSVNRKVLLKKLEALAEKFIMGVPPILKDTIQYLQDRSCDQGYMVSVSGQMAPKMIHAAFTPALQEARRLAKLNPGAEVSVLAVAKRLKAEIIINEVA